MSKILELMEMLETDFTDLQELIEVKRYDTVIEIIKEHIIPNLEDLSTTLENEEIITQEILKTL